jgi:hypothetical protein
MTVTMTNGAQQQRKTLASQLDRLDTILDALSDGLNQAVASTVEQAVGAAVRDTVQGVLAELLTNPLVLTRLREALAPTVPAAQPVPQPAAPLPEPSLADKARSAAQSAKAACGTFLGKMKGWCSVLVDKAKACCRLVRPHTRPLLLAAGVGVALGVTAYFAGPWFAACAGWLAGFAATLGVQAAVAFRRLLGLTSSA